MGGLINKFLGFVGLLICYLAGEMLVLCANLPIPGTLAGLLLLLGFLLVRQQAPAALSAGAGPLLNHMTVLFVPAVTAVVLFWNDIQAHWVGIVAAIVGATLGALAISAWLASYIFTPTGRQDDAS